MQERTLAIIKPDAVSRQLVGRIITLIELEGFKIVDMNMIYMTKEQANELYKVYKDEPFYDGQTNFMSSGPCVMMVLEGEDVISKYRKLMGPTNHTKAEPGTIRHAFGTTIRYNVVHGSDSKKSADFEINYFFGNKKC